MLLIRRKFRAGGGESNIPRYFPSFAFRYRLRGSIFTSEMSVATSFMPSELGSYRPGSVRSVIGYRRPNSVILSNSGTGQDSMDAKQSLMETAAALGSLAAMVAGSSTEEDMRDFYGVYRQIGSIFLRSAYANGYFSDAETSDKVSVEAASDAGSKSDAEIFEAPTESPNAHKPIDLASHENKAVVKYAGNEPTASGPVGPDSQQAAGEEPSEEDKKLASVIVKALATHRREEEAKQAAKDADDAVGNPGSSMDNLDDDEGYFSGAEQEDAYGLYKRARPGAPVRYAV